MYARAVFRIVECNGSVQSKQAVVAAVHCCLYPDDCLLLFSSSLNDRPPFRVSQLASYPVPHAFHSAAPRRVARTRVYV